MTFKPDELDMMLRTQPEKVIGRVGAALGGQTVKPPLNERERNLYDLICASGEIFERRIAAKRVRNAERQRTHRSADAPKERDRSVTDAPKERDKGVTDAPKERDKGVTDAPKERDKGVTLDIRSRSRSFPSLSIPILKPDSDSDSDPRAGARDADGARTASESESGTESGFTGMGRPETATVDVAAKMAGIPADGFDPWKAGDDEILYGQRSAATVYRLAFGDSGAWRIALKQAGEDAMRTLFLSFRAECRAGEIPRNPAAAITARLAKDLGVRFGKGARNV